MDYRDLPKKEYQFDRVVSVGMLEHVGRDNYQLFLDCVEKVLKPGGLFLLHFISALKEHPGDPWVKKYIFPGGTVPSLREILNHMAEDNFHTLDIENLRLHYNKTLLHWEKNFRDNIEKEKTMFDEEFLRMWDLYLSACAATFHNGIIDLHQILMTKGINNDLPMTRGIDLPLSKIKISIRKITYMNIKTSRNSQQLKMLYCSGRFFIITDCFGEMRD